MAIGTQTADEIVEKILHLPEGSKVFVMAPVDRRDNEDYAALWDDLRGSGFARVRVDGDFAQPGLAPRAESPPEAPDRGRDRPSDRPPQDPLEARRLGRGGFRFGERRGSRRAGSATRPKRPRWPVDHYSQHRILRRLRPELRGAVAAPLLVQRPDRLVPRSARGSAPSTAPTPPPSSPTADVRLNRGAVVAWPKFVENPAFARMIGAMARVARDRPGHSRSTTSKAATAGPSSTAPATPGSRSRRLKDQPGFAFQYKGLFPAIEEAARVSFVYRHKLHGMVDDVPCASCMGARLRDDSAAVRFRGHTIDQVGHWPLGRALEFFEDLEARTADEKHIAGDLVREIRDRLQFLVDVGLDYLSLEPGDAHALRAARASESAWPARSAAA